MTVIIPSYPGVYVQEDTSLSLSIGSSATAVPVFFFDTADAVKPPLELTPIDSWLTFYTALKLADNPKPDVLYKSKIVCAMRAYFDNGGGRCYTAPVDLDTPEKITALQQNILAKTDITLLVQAGSAPAKFETFIGTDITGIFAIYDALAPLPEPQAVSFAREGQGAAYYPSLKSSSYIPPKENGDLQYSDVPASAVVAGIYCKTDSLRGVWKAPANVAIVGGLKPSASVSDTYQGKYNDDKNKAINMIRQFRGGETLVWGARTLDKTANWRYVPVRRLFNAVEKDIKAAMQPALFEPNTPLTWETVRSAIDSYLYGIWKQGGLFGLSPQEAYFVSIGLHTTMTQAQITAGQMIVKVGIAAVRPAEFIILEFSQFTAAS